MVKKAVPWTFRTDNFNREEYANGKGEGMVRAPSSGATTSLNEPELKSGRREKELAQERPVPLKLERAKACKIKKAQISPPTVQRRVHWPLIIHTSAPKVIRTDPSNFMWLVQNLTGSSITRSRCEKRRPQSADDLLQEQTETLVERATTEELEVELFLADTIISKSSSDEEDSLTIQSTLEEAVSGFPESPNAAPVEDDASPRGPLPRFDWFCPSVAPDESNFTTSLASSFQFSSYPDSLDITTTPLTVPFLEPICDSFACSFSFPRDASFNSLSDLLLLSPSRLDGCIS